MDVFVEKCDEEDEIIFNQTLIARLVDLIRMNIAKEMKDHQVNCNKNGGLSVCGEHKGLI